MASSQATRIFPVFIVLFLGYFGFSLALPLFPPLFLDPIHSFLPEGTSTEMRRILLGILFAMYPMGQFVGAPVLGKLSDKYGRRPILLISLLAVIPTYMASAFSILYQLPGFLFLIRFLSGILEGNVVIAQAAVADVSVSKTAKTKQFGWIVSLSSTGFFFGPLIGGKFADAKNVKWFHYDIPFWCAALLTFIAFIIVYALFKETHRPDRNQEVSVRSITKSFTKGLKIKALRVIFSSNLFIYMGMFFFLNFFSPYLVNRYQFSFSLLGEVNAYLSIPFIISPFFFGLFAKWWSSRQSMRFGALCICISYLIFVLPTSPWALLATLIPVGFFLAMGFAFPALMVSDHASPTKQGQALGTNQSLQVFGEAITALVGGFIMAGANTLPIYAGALCAFVGAVILFIRPQKV